MILPLRVLGRSSTTSMRRGATAAPSWRRAWAISVQQERLGIGSKPGPQHDEAWTTVAGDRVGHAVHAGLGHRRVLHQRALHLERTDQVPGRLDDVVGSADEPEVAVGVAARRGRRTGTTRRRSTRRSAPRLVEVAAEHRGPARPQGQHPDRRRGRRPRDVARASERPARPRRRSAGSPASMPGSGRPIEPGRIGIAGEVGDHDPAGLGLPPVVVERAGRAPRRPSGPPRGSAARRRWRRTADRRQVVRASAARRRPASACGCAVGAVYQTLTRSLREDPVPALGVEVAPRRRCWSRRSVSGAMIPYDVPVTQPGSAVHQNTSSVVQIERQRPVAWWATTASWTCSAPFGVPSCRW